MSSSSPAEVRWTRRRARMSVPSLPERPTALPPWWLISPTISLLIRPTRTISTLSSASWPVPRFPPTKRGSSPRRFIIAPICGPPPCTMTGRMPTSRSSTTSRANCSLRPTSSMAEPPNLMTSVLPWKARRYGRASRRISARCTSVSMLAAYLEDIPREILVLEHLGQPCVHICRIDSQLLAPQLGSLERHVFQELLHHRIQTARPDVLGPLVDGGGDLRDGVHGVRREREDHALRLQQLDVLPHQGVLGFAQNADKILARQGLELDPDREPPLQLRDQVRGLGDVERAGCDEQDVVRADRPVLGRDRRPLDDRQQIALHPFPGDVRAVRDFPARDLVELIEEHDAGVLRAPDRLTHGLVHVHQLLRLLLRQQPAGLRDLHPPLARPAGHQVREHVLQIDADLLHALSGEHLEHGADLRLHVHLDHALVELARPKLRPELVPRLIARRIRRHLLERAAREALPGPPRQQE